MFNSLRFDNLVVKAKKKLIGLNFATKFGGTPERRMQNGENHVKKFGENLIDLMVKCPLASRRFCFCRIGALRKI